MTILAAAFVGIHFHASVASQERSASGRVDVINRSYPTACAEEDNVDLEFVSKTITGFTVRVSYPSYIQNVTSQRSESNFDNCSFGGSKSTGNAANRGPQKIVFYQSPGIRLVGLKFASFWRRPVVPVIVDGHRELGAQLIQLWLGPGDKEEEVLAFYPPDGYWRFRPLPYGKLRLAAYGSSILFGPVERGGGRPYVAIKQVVFDPPSRSFRLDFDAGGSATLKLLAIDDHQCTISVSFAGPMPRNLPFAALRSMFRDEGYADVARIAWAKDQPAELVSSFQGGMVSRLWMGRSMESRHNNTAPDHEFSDFILKEPVKKVVNEHSSSHQIGT